MKRHFLLTLAGAFAVALAGQFVASTEALACGPGYKKVGNHCVIAGYNPDLKLKARTR